MKKIHEPSIFTIGVVYVICSVQLIVDDHTQILIFIFNTNLLTIIANYILGSYSITGMHFDVPPIDLSHVSQGHSHTFGFRYAHNVNIFWSN